ncbi:MAG: hypothetical protein ACT4PL_11285, partial [Phycisphaerales bacterium]
AGLRMAASEFLTGFTYLLTFGVAAAAVCLLVERLLGIVMPWRQIAIYAPAGLLIVALAWTFVRRPAAMVIAQRVDDGANLKDSLSTALSVNGREDPWCRNVIEAAARTAVGVDVRRAVPVRTPRAWPAPMTAGLVLVAMWVLLPSMDLLKKQAKAEAVKEETRKVEQAKVETQDAVKRVEEALAKVETKNEKDERGAIENERPEGKSPEEIRRAAIKKIENMKEKIEQLKSSNEKALNADALKDMLKQLRQPGPGPMADVAGALSKGDFSKAEQALEELSKQISSGDMKEQDKKELSKQLDRMKDQLANLAGNQKKAEEMLEKAGLDKNLAKATPEQMKQAIEQAQGLTKEQKEQLQKALDAQQQAQNQCQNMSDSMSGMSEGMKKDGQKQGQEGMSQQTQQGMEQLQQQLSQAEMMSQEANSLEAAMSEADQAMENLLQGMGQCDNPGMGQCEGGLNGDGQGGDKGGEFAEGESQNQGNGYGKAGRANGGRPEDAVAAENWQKRKFKTALGQGPVIGTMLVQGEQVKGESRAQFQAAAEAAEAGASEALQQNTIPREYHDAVKHYFGRLKAKVAAQGNPAAPAKPAETPATPAASPANEKK